MNEEWITTAEAAKLGNYHPETIRELVREGRVKGRKFGPVWQVSKSSLLEYLSSVEKLGKRRGPKPLLKSP
jgi:excisionase family DNA binding protein